MSHKTFLVCVIACLVQNALTQVLNLNNCGCQQPAQGINLGTLGNLGNLGISLSNGGNGLTLANTGNSISLANPGCGLNIANGGLSLNLGNSPFVSGQQGNAGTVQGTSQQIGYGDMAIIGELPVAGPTAVCGNVPVIGYVVFEGDVPAGGLVSVVDPCGCQCNQ